MFFFFSGKEDGFFYINIVKIITINGQHPNSNYKLGLTNFYNLRISNTNTIFKKYVSNFLNGLSQMVKILVSSVITPVSVSATTFVSQKTCLNFILSNWSMSFLQSKMMDINIKFVMLLI